MAGVGGALRHLRDSGQVRQISWRMKPCTCSFAAVLASVRQAGVAAVTALLCSLCNVCTASTAATTQCFPQYPRRVLQSFRQHVAAAPADLMTPVFVGMVQGVRPGRQNGGDHRGRQNWAAGAAAPGGTHECCCHPIVIKRLSWTFCFSLCCLNRASLSGSP